MQAELQDILYRRYPAVFADRDLPPTASLMCFGAECGDGWWPLLDALCAVLTERERFDGEVCRAVQVKEKYGSLCFYTGPADDFERAAVSFAETFSNRVCEVIGTPGRPAKQGGWLRTVSPAVARRQGYEWQDLDGWERPRIPAETGAELAALLPTRWSTVVKGPCEVPPGWADIADAFLEECDDLSFPTDRFTKRAPVDAYVRFIGREGDALVIDVVGPEGLQAAAAVARALAERTDPETGAPKWPAQAKTLIDAQAAKRRAFEDGVLRRFAAGEEPVSVVKMALDIPTGVESVLEELMGECGLAWPAVVPLEPAMKAVYERVRALRDACQPDG